VAEIELPDRGNEIEGVTLGNPGIVGRFTVCGSMGGFHGMNIGMKTRDDENLLRFSQNRALDRPLTK
jgi:hypothetical protein